MGSSPIGNTQSIYKLLSSIKKNKGQKEFLLTDIFGTARKKNMPVSLILAMENEVMGVNNLYQLSYIKGSVELNKIFEQIVSSFEFVE